MTAHPRPLRLLKDVQPPGMKLENALRPHRLRINYTADDCEIIPLTIGEYRFIHTVLAESGRTDLTNGVWA